MWWALAQSGEPNSDAAAIVATLSPMRATLLVVLFVAAACGTSAPAKSYAPTASAELTADLFPLAESTAQFVDVKNSAARTVRVVPSPDGTGARLLIEGPGGRPSEIRVTRRDASVFFSSDVDLGTELLRLGAQPGDAWESAGWRVKFDGWERVRLADESVDSARISTRRGSAELERVETWWFARGKGVVRLKLDHGSLFVDELLRSSP